MDASPQAAWWRAKRDKPLLVMHNKYAQVQALHAEWAGRGPPAQLPC